MASYTRVYKGTHVQGLTGVYKNLPAYNCTRVNNGTQEFIGMYRDMQDVQQYKVKVGTFTRVYRSMQEYTVVYKGLQRITMVYIRVYLGEYKSLHWYTRV